MCGSGATQAKGGVSVIMAGVTVSFTSHQGDSLGKTPDRSVKCTLGAVIVTMIFLRLTCDKCDLISGLDGVNQSLTILMIDSPAAVHHNAPSFCRDILLIRQDILMDRRSRIQD